MTRISDAVRKSAGPALFAALAAALVPGISHGQKPSTDVRVVNTPLPVTGTLGVSGSINATQSGTWNVGISGKPAVVSGDTTVLLDSFSGTINTSFNQVVSADITGMKTVRVLANCFVGADCANILMRVYNAVGGRSYLVEEVPMLSFRATTRVYEVIGVNITVQLVNNTGGSVANIGAALYGRAN